jgi:hypothetical protein
MLIIVSMHYSEILNQRPFNLNDGDRYFIEVITFGGNNFVLINCSQNGIEMCTHYISTRTYTTLEVAKHVVDSIKRMPQYENTTLKIHQVKNVFEPRYAVMYMQGGGNVTNSIQWFVIGKEEPDTYTDYETAKSVLEKYKRNEIELYYNKIMKLKSIELNKI